MQSITFPTEALDKCTTPEGVATLACIPIVLTNVINFMLALAGIVAAFLVVFAGAKFVTSQGDRAKLDSARKTFFWAIIGLVIVVFSVFLLAIIGRITGVEQLPTTNP